MKISKEILRNGAAYRIRTYDPLITNDSEDAQTRSESSSEKLILRLFIFFLRKLAQILERKLRP